MLRATQAAVDADAVTVDKKHMKKRPKGRFITLLHSSELTHSLRSLLIVRSRALRLLPQGLLWLR